MAQLTAGRAVLDMLRAEGIDHIFGLVGTTTNSIITEMYGRTDMRFIDTRHEEGAAFMAYGYARASGKPTACVTTSGPGSINLLTGIALADKGRAPVVVIAGDVAREHLDRNGSQAFDLVDMFRPVTRYARQAHLTERIPGVMRDALRAATTGHKGPVFVDIPRDLMDHQTIDEAVLPPESYRPVDQRLQGDAHAIAQAAQLLLGAERPVLLAGGGVIDADATQAAVALAEALDMAMVPAYGHNDAVPNGHPLYVGMPGRRGAPEALQAIHRADVLLALGSRLSQSTTSWNDGTINAATRIIQVDIAAQEVGRNHPIAVGIVGDARAVAEQLLAAVRSEAAKRRKLAAWRSEIAEYAARRRKRLDAEQLLQGDPMMLQRVYPELRKVLPRDCMVTLDAGVAAGLAYERLQFELPRTLFNYAAHGGLGMGYCVGLGTKLGRPERKAVTLQGDGGFMYTTQEINTAVRFRIPHVSIVLNNRCHGAEKAQQQRNFGARYIGVDLENPRFDRLAEAYGARGFYAARPEDVADAVAAALAVDGPAVVEIPVAEYFPLPAAAPGGRTSA
jgi:thiamine pyrophosphate-dependent acetolactate synthase large subunit-like protein